MNEERRTRIEALARKYFQLRQQVLILAKTQSSEDNEVAYHLASAELNEIAKQLEMAKAPQNQEEQS